MKKLIIAILILVATVLLFTMRGNSPTEIIPRTNIGGSHPDPSNATFIFNDGEITLSNGKSEQAITPGSVFIEETILLDKLAYGDINIDGKEDTALLLARYGGGSGIFIYVAAFVSGPITYKGSDTVFIGDRIAPQNITISNGIVTVDYLDREAGEAMAATPTIPKSMQFVFSNGKLQER